MKSKKNLGRGALFLATLIWGISFVLMDVTLKSIPTFYILAIRFLGAAVILIAVGARDLKKLDRAYLKGGALMGVLLLGAYAFQTFGLERTTPGKNAFLTSVYCIIVPFLFWLLLRKKPDKYNVIAAFVCLVGIGFICLQSNLSIGLGDGLTLVCGLLYAVHMIVCGSVVTERSPILVSMVQFAVAGVLAAVLALVTEPFPTAVTPGTAGNPGLSHDLQHGSVSVAPDLRAEAHADGAGLRHPGVRGRPSARPPPSSSPERR